MSDEQKLASLVKSAVTEALKISELECPECHASFSEPARYMDHRISEGFAKAVEEVRAPDPEKTVLECKDGICALVEAHVEEVYGLEKKVVPPVEDPDKPAEAVEPVALPVEEVKGLWDDMEDEPEDE